MCNWINIKWNECGLVIVMNDLEITSISMVAQWSVQLSGEAVAVVMGERVVGVSGWSPVARVVVLSFFVFCLAMYSSFFFFLSELAIASNFLF